MLKGFETKQESLEATAAQSDRAESERGRTPSDKKSETASQQGHLKAPSKSGSRTAGWCLIFSLAWFTNIPF